MSRPSAVLHHVRLSVSRAAQAVRRARLPNWRLRRTADISGRGQSVRKAVVMASAVLAHEIPGLWIRDSDVPKGGGRRKMV